MKKNTNTNYNATQLVDLIYKVRSEKHNEASSAYAYAVGTLQAIINNALLTTDKKYLQESINSSYENFSKELAA